MGNAWRNDLMENFLLRAPSRDAVLLFAELLPDVGAAYEGRLEEVGDEAFGAVGVSIDARMDSEPVPTG